MFQYSFVTPLTSLVVVKPNATDSSVDTETAKPGKHPALLIKLLHKAAHNINTDNYSYSSANLLKLDIYFNFILYSVLLTSFTYPYFIYY